MVDKPQITLKSLLSGIGLENVIETWRIRRIGGLSKRENLVVLLSDGTHLCTCMETVTKGIICRHFWRVMLYSNSAKFHISIIPARWYKDNITNLDCNFENSPVLSAIESANTLISSSAPSVSSLLTFQNLHHFQGVEHGGMMRQNNSQRNRFGVAFSTAKTAINIALEIKTDGELIRILKDFITAKREKQSEDGDADNNLEDQLEQDVTNIIVPLQQHLIKETTNPNVTKIRGAPSKKRLKNAMELSKKKVLTQEHLNDQGTRNQRKCLLCGKPGHYQKKCLNANREDQYRGIILFIWLWNHCIIPKHNFYYSIFLLLIITLIGMSTA